ncbi:MAG: MBL fold metallo-hydrolase [Clostridia bacterium]|nr:MBL fold metallo-hydrolase [Clostridia bacterium]
MKYSTLTFPDIYRITLPYKDIFTTVVILRTPEGDVMLDAASYDEDITDTVLPALEELGVTRESLKHLVISHNHGDHAGGLAAFLKAFPEVEVLSGSASLAEKHPEANVRAPLAGELLLGCLEVVSIPGHTQDAVGLLDRRSATLVSGDALQQFGIFGSGKWGSNIRYPALHRKAVRALMEKDVKGILSAHDFHPVGQFAHSAEEAHAFMEACLESLDRIEAFDLAHPGQDKEDVAAAYNAEGTLPTVGAHVFAALERDRTEANA